MATLLVSPLVPLCQEIQYSLGSLNTVTQIFKIVAPFVFLSAAFATLNARLGMPPFALFLIALCLTDGATTCLFATKRLDISPTPSFFLAHSDDDDILLQRYGYW